MIVIPDNTCVNIAQYFVPQSASVRYFEESHLATLITAIVATDRDG